MAEPRTIDDLDLDQLKAFRSWLDLEEAGFLFQDAAAESERWLAAATRDPRENEPIDVLTLDRERCLACLKVYRGIVSLRQRVDEMIHSRQ